MGTLHLLRLGADISGVADGNLAGPRHAAAVQCGGRNGRRTFFQRRHQTVFIHGRHGGIGAGPLDPLIGGIGGIHAGLKLECIRCLHRQRGPVQGNAGHRLQHRYLAAGAGLAHTDLDGGGAHAHGFHQAGIADRHHSGVAAFPNHLVGEVLRRYRQHQLAGGTLVQGQGRLIQAGRGGRDLPVHEFDAVGFGEGLGICSGHAVNRQLVQVAESVGGNAGDAAGDGNGAELDRILEGVVLDGCHAPGHRQLLQCVAVPESGGGDGRDAGAQLHIRQSIAVIEHGIAQRRHAVGDGDFCQPIAVVKRLITHRGNRGRDVHFRDGVAIVERIRLDELRRLAPHEFLQRGAVFECTVPDVLHRLRQHQLLQRRAARKGGGWDQFPSVGQGYICKTGAVGKYLCSYVYNRIRQFYIRQSGAATKCSIFNFCYRVWNCYCYQSAVQKGAFANLCHTTWNNNI